MATEKQQRAWLAAARARLEETDGMKRVHLIERIVELEQVLGLTEPADPEEEEWEEEEDVRLPRDLSELMAATAAAVGGAEGPVAG